MQARVVVPFGFKSASHSVSETFYSIAVIPLLDSEVFFFFF